MTTALSLAIRLADEIEQFPLGHCSPSDDPDKQYAYTAEFRDMAKRFVAAVRRIGDPDLSNLVVDLGTSPQSIVEAHELRAELYVVIDALKEVAQDPNYATTAASNAAFLAIDVLTQLKGVTCTRLDTSRLVKMCEELNDAYGRANYISTSLLLRAIINHVPPVFGFTSFSQVVAQSGRSVKSILSRLEDDARPMADLHTHVPMRRKDYLPTKNQLESYKAPFEVLIQEIIVRLNDDET